MNNHRLLISVGVSKNMSFLKAITEFSLKNHHDSEKLLTFGGLWKVSTVTSPRKDPPLPSCGAYLSCLSNPDCFASKPSRNMDFYQDLLYCTKATEAVFSILSYSENSAI